MTDTVPDPIETKLDYRFQHRPHLELALIHPSFRHEQNAIEEDNQRLEFLGDAALGLAAAAYVYHTFGQDAEGALTNMRSHLTNRSVLAKMGEQLELGPRLRLGEGEQRSGGTQRESNIGDAMEAVLGAVFLDGGYPAIEHVFRHLWRTTLNALPNKTKNDNPKGELQEYCQKHWKIGPTYRILSESGPAHERTYVCQVVIAGREYARGQGACKRAAEAEAARTTLNTLQPHAHEKEAINHHV